MKKERSTMLTRLGNKSRASASSPKTLPLTMSSVFSFEDIKTLDEVYDGEREGYVYTRMRNPVHDSLGEIMSHIDGGEDAQIFSSGMAAITMTILSHVSPGDHIIASHVLYGETFIFLKYELSRYNIEVSFVDFEKEDGASHFKANTKLVYIETISNPLIAVTDIPTISKLAHEKGAKVMVDNTFATPLLCQPLQLGADIALYSATKYICGHGDITGGIVVSDYKTIANIRTKGTLYGTVMSPFDSWMLIRSLKTLDVRMKRHSDNALKLAEYFARHEKIKEVFYPGLTSSPSHKLAKSLFQDNLYGGMLTIDVLGGAEKAYALVEALEHIDFVPSLADVETMVSCPSKTSHRDMNDIELEKAGISKGLIRISVGLEHVEDLIQEFDEALKSI